MWGSVKTFSGCRLNQDVNLLSMWPADICGRAQCVAFEWSWLSVFQTEKASSSHTAKPTRSALLQKCMLSENHKWHLEGTSEQKCWSWIRFLPVQANTNSKWLKSNTGSNTALPPLLTWSLTHMCTFSTSKCPSPHHHFSYLNVNSDLNVCYPQCVQNVLSSFFPLRLLLQSLRYREFPSTEPLLYF